MAVNLSIKNVPEELAERLRLRAERNHRSLQGELLAIVSTAIDEEATRAAPAPRSVSEGTAVGWRTIEEIAAELKRRFPKPISGVPLGVDIIRADRDSR